MRTRRRRGTSGYCVRLPADYFERLIGDSSPARLHSRIVALDSADVGLLVDAQQSLQKPSPALLEQMGLRLGAAALRAHGGSTTPQRPVSTNDRRRVAEAIQFIQENYERPLSLEDMGQRAGLSAWHFLRVFRAVAETTPHEFLVRTHLRAAAARLRGTQESVTSIAMAVGFGDLSNFTRKFRETFAYAPQAYRRRYRVASSG